MNRFFSYPNRVLISTGTVSVALISGQVALMQLLSIMQWHHYANMVISIALLGFGAAGTFLSLFRKRLLDNSATFIPLLMIMSGLTMLFAVWLSRSGFARFDSYLLFVDRSQWFALSINYLLFFLPFFCGALALGIIFIKYVNSIGKFYSSNLIGSGIGAIMAALLSWYFLPAAMPAVFTLLAMISGLILITPENKWLVSVIATAGISLASYQIIHPPGLHMSQYKSLSRTLNMPAAKIILQKPTPFGFVEVVSAEGLRYAPGLSLAYTGEVPVKNLVFNNGEWFGPVVAWNPGDSSHLLDYTTMGLPYSLGTKNSVLVLHAGTGLQISHALSNKASTIDAIEPHRGVIELLMDELATDNDSLFYNPAVKLYQTEPRSFLSAAKKNYTLIQLPIAGAFGGTSGLFAMREEYSLTKEAFLQMWKLLEEDGAISITAWMDYPFRNPLKIAATLAESAEAAGLSQLRSHLVAVRSWGTITFLLKKTALTPEDTARVRRFCDKFFFDPAILPGMSDEERFRYNGMSDTSFFSYLDELLSGKREKLYRDYEFSLNPATDDKPYFSQFLRWKSLPHLKTVFGEQSVPFLELGWLISAVTFLQISLLAVLLILLPLFRIGWKGGDKFWTLLYFSGLGIGYMFIEIILIQKFILFFGNPVYAVAFVIGVMLLASGAGSYFSSSWVITPDLLRRILVVIILLLLLYSFFLSTFLQYVIGFSFQLKFILALLLIALPGFFMGMPFPMGIKKLSVANEINLPWAWGINGCMSVISAALATLLTVEMGFTVVMLLAAGAYLLCLLSMYISHR